MTPPHTHLIQGLGRFAVRPISEAPGIDLSPSQRQTLAALLAHGPEGTSAENLADTIWPDDLPGNWKPALRMGLSRLRGSLPAGALPHGRYRLALDPSHVDLWHLRQLAAEEDRVPTPEEIEWALAGEPFPAVELSPQISRAVFAVKRAQRRLVDRFCSTAPASLPDVLCDRLEWMVGSEPIEDGLAAAVGRFMIRAGRAADARRLLQSFAIQFEQEMGLRPDPVDEVLAGLVGVADNGIGHNRRFDPERRVDFPTPILSLRGRRCAGREGQLAALTDADRSLVIGPRGAGKSQLLAHLADRAVTGGDAVSYVLGIEDAGVPFAPFLAAFPKLRSVLTEDADRIDPDDPGGVLDPGAVRNDDGRRALPAAQWQATLSLLEEMAQDGAHHVLIDDAQWLDSSSMALLRLLAWSVTEHRVRLCVAGRSDVREPRWLQMIEELARIGFATVEVGGLDLQALQEIVQWTFPSATFEAQRALAVEVLGSSGGLPAVAVPIIGAADPVSLTVADRIGASTNLRWVVEELPRPVRDVGVAAAVLGHEFSVSELVTLFGAESDDVERALDDLIEQGLVVLTDDLDRLTFQHLLIREAFLDAAPPFRRRQLERDAAAVVGDVHAVARHLFRALPNVRRDDAVKALIRSAEEYAASRQWRQTANRLREAEMLGSELLSIDDLTLYAKSLDLSGLDGSGPRGTAFQRASRSGQWPRALAAALAGLPEAERPDGDLARLAMLRQVPAGRLSDEPRFAHALYLARSTTLGGDPVEGRRLAGAAQQLAANPQQAALAHLAQWTAHHHVIPGGYAFPDEMVAVATGSARLRMTQLRAITAMERGDLAGCRELHEQFAAGARAAGDPLRTWHAMNFDALLAFEDGKLVVGAEQADEAYRFGLFHGFQESTSVWLGQVFSRHFAERRHGELVEAFELVPANVGRSTIAQAARALSHAASGRMDEAAELAHQVVEEALARHRSLSLPAVAMVSEVIGSSGEPMAVKACREFLLPFAPSPVVVGFGVAGMGPVWRYLVPLAGDDGERRAWLEEAVVASDAFGSLLWRVLNRITVAVLGPDDERLEEARRLAVGTDLAVDAIAARWRTGTVG